MINKFILQQLRLSINPMQVEQAKQQSMSGQYKGDFVKGMTLDQYMSKSASIFQSNNQQEVSKEQENLYESSQNYQIDQLFPKGKQYCMREIDQESLQDSSQSHAGQENTDKYEFGKQNELSKQNKDENHNPWKSKINSISMNVTAFFKGEKQDRNSFRIKQTSVSPSKRNQKQLINGPVTIYGTKFGQATKKKSINIPELVTVTKMEIHSDLKSSKDTLHNKDKLLKKESITRNTKRKTQLDLNQLLSFQSRIKNNYSQNTYVDEFKMQRTNKINQRKNKFC